MTSLTLNRPFINYTLLYTCTKLNLNRGYKQIRQLQSVSDAKCHKYAESKRLSYIALLYLAQSHRLDVNLTIGLLLLNHRLMYCALKQALSIVDNFSNNLLSVVSCEKAL